LNASLPCHYRSLSTLPNQPSKWCSRRQNRFGTPDCACYTTRVRALEIAIGLISLVIWLYLFFARGQFWRVNKLFAPPSPAPFSARIVAVIPARNEAQVIARGIASLLELSNIHAIVVDDNSTDDTGRLAVSAASSMGAADRLTLVTGSPLAPGWSGKLWAMHQGLQRARDLQPDFFLLTDADVVHSPADIERLIHVAENGPYDLVSLMVRLTCETIPEKLLIPAFVYFFFKLYPSAFIRDPRRLTAGAAGGCILIRPLALENAGGVSAIRHDIIDDCALARIVKRSGGRIWLGAAQQTRSIRPYVSFDEIGRMISRTAFNQLGHSWLLLLGTVIGLLLTYIAPVGLLFSAHRDTVVPGFTALLMMVGSYVPMTRYYGNNPLWALTLPLAAVFYMAATVMSAIRFSLGRGGEWKGRAQDLIQTR
jgi:hopene-associated glycosyltransferase HpnB